MSQTLLPPVRRVIAHSSSLFFQLVGTLLLRVLTLFLLVVVAYFVFVQAAEVVTFLNSPKGGFAGKLASICFQWLVVFGFAAMLDLWEYWDEE